MGGVATPLIERNTTIPTRKSQQFSTASDNQTQVEIHVVQGERSMVADNKSLGNFMLDGIPPAPRGIPQVEVTFDIDANGILKVTASDKATGRSQHITLTASSGLTPAEVEQMRSDAQAHAEEDRKRRDGIDLRNQADHAIYAAEKATAGENLSDVLKAEVQQAVSGLKEALQGENLEAIRAKISTLNEAAARLSNSVRYSDPNAQTRPLNEDFIDGEAREF